MKFGKNEIDEMKIEQEWAQREWRKKYTQNNSDINFIEGNLCEQTLIRWVLRFQKFAPRTKTMKPLDAHQVIE